MSRGIVFTPCFYPHYEGSMGIDLPSSIFARYGGKMKKNHFGFETHFIVPTSITEENALLLNKSVTKVDNLSTTGITGYIYLLNRKT